MKTAHAVPPRVTIAIDIRQSTIFKRKVTSSVDFVHVRPLGHCKVFSGWISLFTDLRSMFQGDAEMVSGVIRGC
jgi:hypothetical protein